MCMSACGTQSSGSTNQMISCAMACRLRSEGISRATCRTMCQRDGGSGCSIWSPATGQELGLCGGCTPDSITVEQCEAGCDFDFAARPDTGLILSPGNASRYADAAVCVAHDALFSAVEIPAALASVDRGFGVRCCADVVPAQATGEEAGVQPGGHRLRP